MSDVSLSPATPIVLPLRPPQAQDAWLRWVSAVDHKQIGILYLLTTVFFFIVGGIEALLVRIPLALPGNRFLNPEA